MLSKAITMTREVFDQRSSSIVYTHSGKGARLTRLGDKGRTKRSTPRMGGCGREMKFKLEKSVWRSNKSKANGLYVVN